MTYLFLALLAIGLIVVVAASSRRRSLLSAAILAFAQSMDTTPLHAKTRSLRRHQIR